jgi:hypothetical protein
MEDNKDKRELNTEEEEQVVGGQKPTPPDLPEDLQKGRPFYTGKKKLVDSGGRVDRFRKRLEGQ